MQADIEALRLHQAQFATAAGGATQRATLDAFLRSVERRALRMAQLAVGNREDALDIVQDSMLLLVRKYSGRPADEWRPLFHRILQSRITDHHRRRAVRNRLFGWLGAATDDEEQPDRMAGIPDPQAAEPAAELAMLDGASALARAIEALPLRQKQAFMLRAWEGLDVAQTAAAMGCSEGSVKTHYFRAIGALRAVLEEHFE